MENVVYNIAADIVEQAFILVNRNAKSRRAVP